MTLLDHLEWIDAQASSGVSGGPVASKTSTGRTGRTGTSSTARSLRGASGVRPTKQGEASRDRVA
jgi:hypothetical protein